MTRDLIIGVEVGASEAAACAYDRDGRAVACAVVSGLTLGEGAGAGDMAEPDLAKVQAAAVRSLERDVLDLSRRTAAVACAAQHSRRVRTADGTEAHDGSTPSPDREARIRQIGHGDTWTALLDPAIPEVIGPKASVCAAIAAGLHDGSDAGCSVLGRGEAHLRCRGGAVPEADGADMVSPAPDACWLVDLARDLLADFGLALSRRDFLCRFDSELMKAAPGGLLFEADREGAGGETIASRAHIFGLSTRHGFGHLLRASAEAFGFAARRAYAPPPPGEIRLCGAAVESFALSTIVASTSDTPVRALAREWPAAAGAAMVAAVTIGQEAGHESAATRWAHPHLGPTVRPDGALVQLYHRLYPAMLEAGLATAAVRSGLHALPGPVLVANDSPQGTAAHGHGEAPPGRGRPYSDGARP